jgi:hypothetical protein
LEIDKMARGMFAGSKAGPSYEEATAPARLRYEKKVFAAIVARLKAQDFYASQRGYGFAIKSPPTLYKNQRTLAFEVFFYNAPTTIRHADRRGRRIEAKPNTMYITVFYFDQGSVEERWSKANIEWDLRRSPDDVGRAILGAIPNHIWPKWEKRAPKRRKKGR